MPPPPLAVRAVTLEEKRFLLTMTENAKYRRTDAFTKQALGRPNMNTGMDKYEGIQGALGKLFAAKGVREKVGEKTQEERNAEKLEGQLAELEERIDVLKRGRLAMPRIKNAERVLKYKEREFERQREIFEERGEKGKDGSAVKWAARGLFSIPDKRAAEDSGDDGTQVKKIKTEFKKESL